MSFPPLPALSSLLNLSAVNSKTRGLCVKKQRACRRGFRFLVSEWGKLSPSRRLVISFNGG